MTQKRHLRVANPGDKLPPREELAAAVVELMTGTGGRIHFDSARELEMAELENMVVNLETMRSMAGNDLIVKVDRWQDRYDKSHSRKQSIDIPPIDFGVKAREREGKVIGSYFGENGNWRTSMIIGGMSGFLLGVTAPALWTDQLAGLLTGSEPYPHVYTPEDAPSILSFLTNKVASAYVESGCDSYSRLFSLIINSQLVLVAGVAASPVIRGIHYFRRNLESQDLTLEPEQFGKKFKRAKMSKLAGMVLSAALFGTAISGLIESCQIQEFEEEICREVHIPLITEIVGVRATSLEEELKRAMDHYYWSDRVRAQVRDGALEVYFPTGKADLSPSHRYALERAVHTLRGIEHYVIEGHADFRGHPDDNYRLGLDRSLAAAEVIRTENPRAKITTVSVGEKEATETSDQEQLARDRKARLLLSDNPIELGIQQSGTDIYFVDTGAEMEPYWKDVQYSAFPSNKIWVPGSQPHSFQGVQLEQSSVSMKSFYEGLSELLRQSGFKTSITLVTAGQSNGHQQDREQYDQALRIARDRNIILSVVGLGLRAEDISLLGNMAQQTGGMTYFITRQSK